MPDSTSPRIAVVSGASSGIGAAVAVALAERGHPVALGARRAHRCEKLAAVIEEKGGRALALPLDVGDDASVAAFATAVRDHLGEPGIVISNAGGVVIADALDASTEQLTRELNINVLGAHRLAAAFVPGMVAKGRGDIVFISSDAVSSPRPGVAGYLAGKAGLEGLAAALRSELEGTGVRASVVRPGPTVSEIAADWDPDAFTALYETWQRWGVQRHDGLLKPEQVAHAVVSVATVPRGMHLPLVEVQPEAPRRR